MAKAKARKNAPNTKEKDIQEFFEALALMGQEKGIPLEYLVEKITEAIKLAVKKDPAGSEQNIVEINPETKRFYVAMQKEVVEEIEDPTLQITIEDAVKYKAGAQVGELVEIPLEPKRFGRIAAQSAKHVIRQGIREAEKGLLYQEFRSRQHDIVTATVLRSDPKRGSVTLEIGTSEAILPKSEQVPGEELTDGQKIRVYVVDAQNGEKGPRLMISRTHPSLVKRLFEMQVPEIYDGVVEIKCISREAGRPQQAGSAQPRRKCGPGGGLHRPQGGAGHQHRGGAGRGENRRHPLQRGPGGVHLRSPFSRHRSLGRDCGERSPQLPGHRSGPAALPGHRQQGPERPPGGEAHRLENRHPSGKRLLRRGRDGVKRSGRKNKAVSPFGEFFGG